MSGEKKRMVEVGGRRKSRRSEELCSTDTVKKADRNQHRLSEEVAIYLIPLVIKRQIL